MKTTIIALLASSLLLGVTDAAHAQPALPCTTNTSLVIGGFTIQRGGNLSFTVGSHYSQARTSVVARFPEVSFNSLTALDSTSLSNVDVLVIASATERDDAVQPLSDSEQAALLAFVRNGGSAIILADNSTFDPVGPAANEAVLGPFDVHIGGTLPGSVTATVTSPSSHPVTSGRFGTVASFTQHVPGGLTNLGAYATPLAVNSIGTALAVIEAGALSPGAGRVVIYSDQNTFVNSGGQTPGSFPASEPLLLNTIDYCRRPPCGPEVSIRVSQVEVCWNSVIGASFQVQYRSDLTTNMWTDFGAARPGISGADCVTDSVLLGQPQKFYRVIRLP